MTSAPHRSAHGARERALGALLVVALLLAGTLPIAAATGDDHLVISEVVTGGTSASDEFIEIHNPTAAPLPLEGLELVYVSASGLSVSRRAAWELGAPDIPPGGHVLVANEAGIYAAIADARFTSGMAATGGSVALRIIGASTAVDAVGWGTATGAWMEGSAASAPPAGSSLERLPGGADGSAIDTDDNAADFVVREVPDPQNSASPPTPDPAASPAPTRSAAPTAGETPPPTDTPPPVATATQTPSTTPMVTLSPTPATPAPSEAPAIDMATARSLPDGTEVTVEGTALTPSEFTDGGGYVADGTGGIAVLITGAAFERGELLRLTGQLDDRYAQRTLRVDAGGLLRLGTGTDPAPFDLATTEVTEANEARLARIRAEITGTATQLSAGTAFPVDDGSGETRVVVAPATAIDTSGWTVGSTLDLVGVVGQRDSSGTGVAGYRILPRDAGDLRAVSPPSGPSETPVPSDRPSPTPGGEDPPGTVSIAGARDLPKNARATVRGVVTLGTDVIDAGTAVIQDATGAIVLRLGDEAGRLVRGTSVEVTGTRSTRSGMETLRVTRPPRQLGQAAEPAATAIRTGEAGEALEARVVAVRGAAVAAPRRSSAGSVSFEIDDGSGPVRVYVAASLSFDAAAVAGGAWLEIVGILAQDTTGSQPLRGYRVWPRAAGDLAVTAPAMAADQGAGSVSGDAGTGPGTGADATSGRQAAPAGTLEAIGPRADPSLRVRATVVAGPWQELGIAGLLWDGRRLVAVEEASGDAMRALLGRRAPPIAVEVAGLRASGVHRETKLPIVVLPEDPSALVPHGAQPIPPTSEPPGRGRQPVWFAAVGRLERGSRSMTLDADGSTFAVDRRCDAAPDHPLGIVGVVGIALADDGRILVPCGGIVPAPVLAALHRGPGADAAPTDGRTADGPTSSPEAPGAAPLAAGLLAVAAVTVGAGAAIARRLARRPEGVPDRDGDAEQPTDDASAGDPPPTAPPTLTLVPVRRERGP